MHYIAGGKNKTKTKKKINELDTVASHRSHDNVSCVHSLCSFKRRRLFLLNLFHVYCSCSLVCPPLDSCSVGGLGALLLGMETVPNREEVYRLLQVLFPHIWLLGRGDHTHNWLEGMAIYPSTLSGSYHDHPSGLVAIERWTNYTGHFFFFFKILLGVWL